LGEAFELHIFILRLPKAVGHPPSQVKTNFGASVCRRFGTSVGAGPSFTLFLPLVLHLAPQAERSLQRAKKSVETLTGGSSFCCLIGICRLQNLPFYGYQGPGRSEDCADRFCPVSSRSLRGMGKELGPAFCS
jgi:hypothetical protein